MIKEGYKGLNNSVYIDNGFRIQIESSTRCNCLCPGCARTKIKQKFDAGKSNLMYPIMDMSLEDFKLLVRPGNNIFRITYSLTLGDPIYSGSFLEQLEYLNTLEKRPWINLHTNGSGRSKDWWYKLGKLLKGRDRVEFAIDGLEDTNKIYRINSKWKTIIEGIKTLKHSIDEIDSDAEVDVRHIIFEHNYHQTIEVCKLAQELKANTLRIFVGDGRTPKHMILKSKGWDIIKKEVNDYLS
jgi:MoaA/NifB/PqqE/SkfB family radical SAM enzyme